MAELGSFISSSDQYQSAETEWLDFDYVQNCKDVKKLKIIHETLRTGKDGHHYPQLLEATEKRLLEALPESEKKRLHAMKARPNLDEIHSAELDLHNWQNSIALSDHKIQENANPTKFPKYQQSTEIEGNYNSTNVKTRALPPVRGSTITHDKSTLSNNPSVSTRSVDMFQPPHVTTGYLDASLFKDTSRRFSSRFKRHCDEIGSLRATLKVDDLTLLQIEHLADRERLKGNEFFKSQDLEKAILSYTRCLAYDPKHVAALTNRSFSHYKLKGWEAAEFDASMALEVDNTYIKAWFRRGSALFQKGAYKQAAQDLAQGLKLAPENADMTLLLTKCRAKYLEVEGHQLHDIDLDLEVAESTSDQKLNEANQHSRIVNASSASILNVETITSEVEQVVNNDELNLFAGLNGAVHGNVHSASVVAEGRYEVEANAHCQKTSDTVNGAALDYDTVGTNISASTDLSSEKFTRVMIVEEDDDDCDDAGEEIQINQIVSDANTDSANFSNDLHFDQNEVTLSNSFNCLKDSEGLVQLQDFFVTYHDFPLKIPEKQLFKAIDQLGIKHNKDQGEKINFDKFVKLHSLLSSIADERAKTHKETVVDNGLDDSDSDDEDSNDYYVDGQATLKSTEKLAQLYTESEDDYVVLSPRRPEEDLSIKLQSLRGVTPPIPNSTETAHTHPIQHPIQIHTIDANAINKTTSTDSESNWSFCNNSEASKVPQPSLPNVSSATTNVSAENVAKAIRLKDDGNKQVAAKDYNRAIELYSASILLDPTLVASYNNRAQAYLTLSNYNKSLEDCTFVLSIDPRNVKALYRRAICYKNLKQYAECTSDVKALLRIDPNNAQAKALANEIVELSDNDEFETDSSPKYQQQPPKSIPINAIIEQSSRSKKNETNILSTGSSTTLAVQSQTVKLMTTKATKPTDQSKTSLAVSSASPVLEDQMKSLLESGAVKITGKNTDMKFNNDKSISETTIRPKPSTVIINKLARSGTLKVPEVPSDPPKTLYELERVWRGMKCHPELFAQYLGKFRPGTYKRVFKESLSHDLISSALVSLRDHATSETTIAFLEGLQQSSAFNMLVHTLPMEDIHNLQAIFVKLQFAAADNVEAADKITALKKAYNV